MSFKHSWIQGLRLYHPHLSAPFFSWVLASLSPAMEGISPCGRVRESRTASSSRLPSAYLEIPRGKTVAPYSKSQGITPMVGLSHVPIPGPISVVGGQGLVIGSSIKAR